MLWHYQTGRDLKVTILDMMAEGEKMMVYWQFDITFTVRPEDEPVFPPLNQPLSWKVATVFRKYPWPALV